MMNIARVFAVTASAITAAAFLTIILILVVPIQADEAMPSGWEALPEQTPCAQAVEAVIRYSERMDAVMADSGAPKTLREWEHWNKGKENRIRGIFRECVSAETEYTAPTANDIDPDALTEEALEEFLRG